MSRMGIHRQGRINASILNHVCTRVKILRKKPDEVSDSLLETVMGINVVPPRQQSMAED